MTLPSLADLLGAEVSTGFEPIPRGIYNGVITEVEVRKGGKGPYLNITFTVHSEAESGDTGQRGRKAWRISSFSPRALNMPGGVSNVVQVCQPEIDPKTSPEDLPKVLAAALVSCPVQVEIDHEQKQDAQGTLKTNADGSPQMREVVNYFAEVGEEFLASFEAEAAGVDDDLPF